MAGRLPGKIPGKFGKPLTEAFETEIKVYPHLPAKTAPVEEVPLPFGKAAAAEQAGLTKRQVSLLFPQAPESIRTILRAEGVRRLRRSSVQALIGFVVARLGGRRIASLAEEELSELGRQLRSKLVTDCTSMRKVVTAARAQARTMTGASAGRLVSTTVDMPGEGVWVFVHTRSADPVVMGEAFAPLRQGAKVPTRPAFPGSRKARWLPVGATMPVPEAPALSTGAPHLVGPAEGVLAWAPNTIIGQLSTAELRRFGDGWRSVGPKVVSYLGNVPDKLRRTLGLAITSIKVTAAPSGVRGYDTVVEIRGRLRPSTDRYPDIDLLPRPKDTFGPGSKIQRLHLNGPILGDTTPAGLSYGPEELNIKMREVEDHLRTLSRSPGQPVDYTLTGYLEHRPTLMGKQPFMRQVRYEWTERGVSRTVTVGVDNAGKVFGPLPKLPPGQ